MNCVLVGLVAVWWGFGELLWLFGLLRLYCCVLLSFRCAFTLHVFDLV